VSLETARRREARVAPRHRHGHHIQVGWALQVRSGTRSAAADAMPNSVKVQTRGRVTLPAQLRLALDVRPGDEVEFVETSPGHFEVKTTSVKPALLRKTTPTNRTSVSVRSPHNAGTPQLDLPL